MPNAQEVAMRHIQVIPGLRSNLEIVDIVDQLPKGAAYPWETRDYDDIDTIVIHHFASEAPLINQANFHINGRGWRALGYHVVIDRSRILQTNDLLHLTNHTSGYNHRAIGISVLGDLSKRDMTPLERELLYAAIVTVKSLFPKAVVKAHNECSKTSCPCTSILRIRADITALEFDLAHANTPNAQIADIVKAQARLSDIYKTATNPGKYQDHAISLWQPIIQSMKDNKAWKE